MGKKNKKAKAPKTGLTKSQKKKLAKKAEIQRRGEIMATPTHTLENQKDVEKHFITFKELVQLFRDGGFQVKPTWWAEIQNVQVGVLTGKTITQTVDGGWKGRDTSFRTDETIMINARIKGESILIDQDRYGLGSNALRPESKDVLLKVIKFLELKGLEFVIK